MKNDCIIGYLPRAYIQNVVAGYIAIIAVNLILALRAWDGLDFIGILIPHEPLIYMGAYIGGIIDWNNAKEVEKYGSNKRRSLIYFKSVGFLYFTMVVINLVSALYTGADIGPGVLVIHGYAFYAACFVYTMIELNDARKRIDHESPLPDQLR